MPEEAIRNFYDRPPVHATESTFRKLNAILPFFTQGQGGRFLDIACHDGEKTITLRRLTAATLTIGTDFESIALSEARARGIPCVAIDLNRTTSLPFPDGSFNFIHAGEIIEHLFSPDILLMEIHRLLAPDGYAVITTPNLASWRNRIALMLGWQPFETEVSTRYIVGNPRTPRAVMSGHIRMFTARALMELVDIYGFTVDQLAGFPIGVPSSFVTHVTTWVDRIVQKVFPMMCDSIIIKVLRKKTKP
jgi:SAM-dependent methyltransferase